MHERYSSIWRCLRTRVCIVACRKWDACLCRRSLSRATKDSLRSPVYLHVVSSSLNVQRLTAKHIGPWSLDVRKQGYRFSDQALKLLHFFHANLVKLKLLIIIEITKGARIFRLKALKQVIYPDT